MSNVPSDYISFPMLLHILCRQKSVSPPNLDSYPRSYCARGHLSKLRRLFLENNELSSLPPEIGKLVFLRWLSLDGNRLTSLPPEIGENKKKKNSLCSVSCQLTYRLTGLLRSLEWLSVENNQLQTLPEELGHLSSLQSLSFFNNPSVNSIPFSILRLPKLQTLRQSIFFFFFANCYFYVPFISFR